MAWYFCWWRGDTWASPNFDACTSWIFLGVTWASPSLSFCPYFISLHHSSLPTLENSLHTKLNTILISIISTIKIIDQLWFNFDMWRKTYKITKYTVALLQKALPNKNSKRKGFRGKMYKMAEICQNRTVSKDQIFWEPCVAQIEKFWTNES